MFNTVTQIDYTSDYTLIQCLDAADKNSHDSDGRGGKISKKKDYETKVKEASIVTTPNTQITASKLNISGVKKQCISITNVLSEKECAKIIAVSEQSGLFKPALLNVGFGEVYAPEARNSDRCIIDDTEFAQAIFERLRNLIPATHKNSGITFEAIGLNERFRILRYDEGHEFPWHHDGNYMRNSRERSFYTLMLYLNDGGGVDFSGGSTLFHKSSIYSTDNVIPSKVVEFSPKTGSALVFDHGILHEGAKVSGGRKYAIRTDVMFRMVK